MSDARWNDPREYGGRERGDERPRVYDERDRDDHDPRDALMRDVDLPRGERSCASNRPVSPVLAGRGLAALTMRRGQRSFVSWHCLVPLRGGPLRGVGTDKRPREADAFSRTRLGDISSGGQPEEVPCPTLPR
jgi:hypothetical protein